MDQEIIKELEEKLKVLHGDLGSELKAHTDELKEGMSQNTLDALSMREEDDVVEEEERLEGRELSLVEDALGRIAEGTYGKCCDCGDDINVERLRAVPYAKYCVPCQSNREK
ncbi:MAG: TraR/DksA family transcriptional regulator [Candidatus Tantalella remota]|nr:TraR/DksA family transcriptional regulator [Candidatus Tantalella remota]